MDEQRVQAYLELIEQLLGCPQGQEAELLKSHIDLLDAGLLAAMEQAAAHLESQGDHDAGWLRGFAAQLAEALRLKTTAPIGEAVGQFLLETLQLIVDQQGNPQQIYPLWAEHQTQFNANLLAVLPTVAAQLFEGEAERHALIAAVLVKFGSLISQFPLGTRWLNLELAIAAYQQSLQVMTRETMPVQWAEAMMNLATAYYSRIRGDRAENLEQVIAAYQQSLQVVTRETMPVQWATAMMNLATTYCNRIRGDRAENLEQAIAACQQSLQVRTRETMPVEWATAMMNLALAYVNRIRGDRAENLEQAIAAWQQSLQVMTREAMPVEWAEETMNLATTYCNRIRGDRAENLEQAIAANQQSLQVMTREAIPVQWATAMMNLALTYHNRIRGDRAENLEQAIAAYRGSLNVFTPNLLPNDCRRTARALGNLYCGEQRWEEAVSVYQTALQAAETLYQSANLLDGKAAELAETADLHRRAAYALARTGHLQQAVEVLEQGRARGLSESLNRDRADLTQLQQTHPDLYKEYQALAHQLRNLESQQRERSTSEDQYRLTSEELRESAIALRQQLTDIIQRIRQIPGYEEFLSVSTFADIKKAVQGCPLVYLVSTAVGSLALIVTSDTIHDVWLNGINETQLIELLRTWFAAYEQSQSDRQAWFDAIDSVTHQLWALLMSPLIDQLQQRQFQQATLIATGYLGLLPLHAAWTKDANTPTGRRYALDDIHFTYAPNARSLTAARAICDRTQADSILAIDEPKHRIHYRDINEYKPVNPLPNSSKEVKCAISTFQNPQILRHEYATREAVLVALPHVNVLHCSCHGNADLQEPLQSGLAMTGDGKAATLTLRDLLNLKLSEGDRGGLRLAILSACETGLSGIENADEAISLPTGLLQAGVAAVIASLWSVSELSTMLLLSKFYDLWRGEQALPPDQSLRQAQIWLRDSTEDKIASLLGYRTNSPNHRPFAHPYYWSAFSYTGI